MPAYDVGYTSGVFDMFHVGHLNVIRRAGELCDRLVVGVATDSYVETAKDRPPVVPFDERCEIVAAICGVDEVIPDTAEDKTVAWSRRRFDAVIKGDDWRGTAKGRRLEDDMRRLGVDVVYIPYTIRTSSTLLRERLQAWRT